MHATPVTHSRRDDFITAIGVLVLLLGTASGNALVLLAMSIIALLLLTAISCHQSRARNAIWVIVIAMATSIAVGSALAWL